MAQPSTNLSTELAQQRTSLAVQRTSMAANRSLMAWVRTGISMIGFGFTIYKFLESFSEELARENTPRNVGMFLIAIGTLSVFFGCLEFWHTISQLYKEHKIPLRKFPLILAGAIFALGAMLLIATFFRLL